MNEFEIRQWLPLVMANDIRLQVHTLSDDGTGCWKDRIQKCPKCQAEWILAGCPEVVVQ